MADPRATARGYFSAARWRAAWRFAWQGLSTAKHRALLALVGITVGVFAVFTLMSIGKSVERKALSEFDAIGTQIISVALNPLDTSNGMAPQASGLSALSTPVSARLGNDALMRYVAQIPAVELASEVQPTSCGNNMQQDSGGQPILAVRAELQDILGLQLAHGRFVHVLDKDAFWVVLGHDVADKLRAAGNKVQPGAELILCAKSMRIAGILAPAQTSSSTIALAIDNSYFISISAARRMVPGTELNNFMLRVRQGVSPIAFARELEALLQPLTARSVETITAQKVIQLRQEQAQTYTRFLAALSSVSLFVGALGILNIMLIAVTERRKEIGLRLAVGADDIDIVLQFLSESVLLSLLGGVLGIVLGLIAAKAATWLAQLPFVFTPASIGLSMGASVVVGVAAGLYPAIKASRLNPVESLSAA